MSRLSQKIGTYGNLTSDFLSESNISSLFFPGLCWRRCNFSHSGRRLTCQLISSQDHTPEEALGSQKTHGKKPSKNFQRAPHRSALRFIRPWLLPGVGGWETSFRRLEFQQQVLVVLLFWKRFIYRFRILNHVWVLFWGFRHLKLLSFWELYQILRATMPSSPWSHEVYTSQVSSLEVPNTKKHFMLKEMCGQLYHHPKFQHEVAFSWAPLWSKRIWFYLVIRHKWWSPQWEIFPRNSMHLSELFLASLCKPRVKVRLDWNMSCPNADSCLVNRKLKQSDSCKAKTCTRNSSISE